METFSIVSQAAGIGWQIYQAEKTAEYRKQVLDGITQIESQNQQILTELDAILNQTKTNYLATDLKGADATINELYNRPEFSKWLSGDQDTSLPPNLVDEIKKEIPDCLTGIHLAIMGTLGAVAPWFQLFVDGAPASSVTGTSRCEFVYRFFSTYLVPVQLRGLALLAAANALETEQGNWKDFLNSNLIAQGRKCQEIASNSISGDDFWCGKAEGHVETRTSKKLLYGLPSQVGIPAGHVVVGYEFVEDGDGRIMFNLCHGRLNSFGSVDDLSWSYSSGDKELLSEGNDSYWLYNKELVLGDDWVVVGIAFQYAGSLTHPDEFTIYRIMPAIQAVQLNSDGTMDISTLSWFTPHGVDTGDYTTDLHEIRNQWRDSFVSQYDFGDNYTLPLSPAPGIATPLSGVQFYFNGQAITAAGKVSVHQNSYQ